MLVLKQKVAENILDHSYMCMILVQTQDRTVSAVCASVFVSILTITCW